MKTPQVIVILILLVVCGCGSGSKVNRLPIQGLIVIEGRRIDHGSITFLPSKGTSGPSANTSVSDGQYQFTTTNGPIAGTHDVLITSAPPDPKSVKMGEPVDSMPKEWKLEATVSQGKMQVNFEF